MEFTAKAKNRLSLKEFEVVNTSSYGIAGHSQSQQQKKDDIKVNIVKQEVSNCFDFAVNLILP